MKYAKLIRLGGELIEASNADYSDYKGFLRCPECDEPVFLRKSHQRGNVPVPDAFVHHKAVPQVSACEMRVGKYDSVTVQQKRSQAHGQRIRKLQISLWKFLKQNLAVSLRGWEKYVHDVKRVPFLGEVVDYGKQVLEGNQVFILEDTLSNVSELLRMQDERIGISPEMEKTITTFIKVRSRDWQLHSMVAKEALDLFLKSPTMAENRHRLCCCLCHPTVLQAMPELLDLDAATEEWRSKFVAYITLQVVFVFLMVDWIGLFNEA